MGKNITGSDVDDDIYPGSNVAYGYGDLSFIASFGKNTGRLS